MTRRSIAALSAYVTLAASQWTLNLTSLVRLGGRETELLVLGFVAVAAMPGVRWREVCQVRSLRLLVSGLLLFGLPSVLLSASSAGVPVLARVALLALAPVLLVLISSVRQGGGSEFLSLLAAALAGVAGCLLFLPVDLHFLERPLSVVLALAAVVSIGVGGILGRGGPVGVALRPALLLMVGPSAVLLLAVGSVVRLSWGVPGWVDLVGVLWGAAEVMLLVYLVREMSPVALGARFLLVPLLTTAEGFVLVRPEITWRLLGGALLLGFGSVQLLRQGDGDVRDSPLSLL